MVKSKMSVVRKKKAGSGLPKPARASKFTKAKKAVSEYMQKHQKVWISELAEELELDLGTLSCLYWRNSTRKGISRG